MTRMSLGIIGLGKMGGSMAMRLCERGYEVFAHDRNDRALQAVRETEIKLVSSLEGLLRALPAPRLLWLMVPYDKVDEVLADIMPALARGDMIIDGGNSHFKESMRRANELAGSGIRFMDVGVSGGPSGARNGACLMIGGDVKDFKHLRGLFKDLSVKQGFAHVGPHGAGHFVKMIHNAIEYGMMQSIAEGFDIMHQSNFNLDLKKISGLFNHGSVVESRLMRWLFDGFSEFGEDMQNVSGTVGRSGEGDWAVDVAKEFGVFAPALMSSVHMRKQSAQKPSYAGKLLTAMRNRFGGHSIK